MPKNVKCKNRLILTNHWCDLVVDSPDEDLVRDCQYSFQKTNGDRIRGMTDAELADWMAECNAFGEYSDASQWLPWLQQPAEVE